MRKKLAKSLEDPIKFVSELINLYQSGLKIPDFMEKEKEENSTRMIIIYQSGLKIPDSIEGKNRKNSNRISINPCGKKENFNPTFLFGLIKEINQFNHNETGKILDKIANDEILANFLIFSYCYIDLKDQDIIRLINVIDKINLKPNGLRPLALWQKYKSVSPKIIEKLMNILIEKTDVGFSWDALQIYTMYKEKPEEKRGLLPVLHKLLKRDNLILKKEKYDTMDNIYYKKAIDDIFDSEYKKSFSEYFVSQMIKSKVSLFNLRMDLEIIRACFKKIIRKYPDIVFSEIVNNKDNLYMKALFHSNTSIDGPGNRYQINLLDCVDEEQLKKWCKIAPDTIPCFLAKKIHLFKYNAMEGYHSWSSFAQFLFDQYGDRKELTDSISENLNQFIWTGSLVSYFEKIKKPMEKLKNHKHKNVRDFSERQISCIEENIQNEKEREKVRDEFGIY